MKTLLHTADGKQYSNDYMTIFATARNLLNDEIGAAVKYLLDCKKVEHQCSLSYLVIIATFITSYNELSSLSYFVGTKYFYT